MLVASSAPLDQFVVRNPSYFFDAPPERALINPDNLHILVDHVKCAAFELPFTTSEHTAGTTSRRCSASWQRAGLSIAGGRRRWRGDLAVDERVLSGGCGQPAVDFVGQLRRGGYHPGRRRHRRDQLHQRSCDAAREGDLLVEGVLYQVERLDFEGRKAFVRRIDCDYYTDAITYTKVTVLDTSPMR